MLSELPEEHWLDLTFFTNSLEHDGGRGLKPKERTIIGDHVVFTFEYDRGEIPFFCEQLDWLLPTKRWEKSKIGKLQRHCSKKWADFCGITVVWSGNKSLHIHVTFEGKTYQRLHTVSGSAHKGLMAHWDALAEDIREILAPSVKLDGLPTTPDPNLKAPGAFRRLPGGSRILDEDNLLGMPAGTIVPQVVLWERFRERAGKGASSLFFSPTRFIRKNQASRPLDLPSDGVIGAVLTKEEVEYCEERLREIYTEYPQLERLRFDSTRGLWMAHFRNSATDRNPSSYMLETHKTICIQGTFDATPPRSLPFRLAAMIKLWTARHKAEKVAQGANASFEALEENFSLRHPAAKTIFELSQVRDANQARAKLEASIPSLIQAERAVLLRGPEGVAKTSSIMRRHSEIMTSIDRPGLAMYAFGDYDNAKEKCEAFNSLSHTGVFGIVWSSFSRSYREACQELGLTEISHDVAIGSGHQSRWSMIFRRQPEVIEVLKQRHKEMWAAIGDREPVLFTVHDVAHRWRDHERTRRMWTRSFWNAEVYQKEQIAETELALLVHDEIKTSNFVDVISAATHGWLQALKKRNPAIWGNPHYALQHKAIAEHAAVSGEPTDIKFDDYEIRRLLAPGEWDDVTTRNTGEYLQRDCDIAEKDIYERCHGRDWLVRPKNWWFQMGQQIASRLVYLTTELAPAAVAKHANPRLFVVDFDTPSIARDRVEVRPRRSVTAENLGAASKDEWESLGQELPSEWCVISNKLSTFDPYWSVQRMTHAAARGSNALIGRNILQTCTFMASARYEQAQALNAWLGRNDLVVTTHIDEINQSCGRNLGFRRKGAERHILLINLRLYHTLEARGAFGGMRYDFVLQFDAEQRREARRS